MRQLEEDRAALTAEYIRSIVREPKHMENLTIEYFARLFDAGAYRISLLFSDYEDVKSAYVSYIERLEGKVVNEAKGMMDRWPSPINRDSFIARLRLVLLSRMHHHKAEALKYVREMGIQAQVAEPPSRTVKYSPAFPNRASWLKIRLHERSWNKHDIARQGGPDRKTVQKILDGQFVREDGLEKLVNALNKKRNVPKVDLTSVPTD